MTVNERLLQHGIRLRRYDEGDHKTTCPQCSPTRKNSKDPCLSVKIDGDGGAAFNCHHCGWVGNVPSERYAKPREPKYHRPALPENRDQGDKLAEWMAGRGISPETYKRAGVYLTTRHIAGKKTGAIAYPYFHGGETVNIKYRTRDKQFAQEAGTQRTLYNADNALGGETVVICEGEMDVLACMEAGIDNAVSLPDGAPAKRNSSDKRYQALQPHADQLEQATKIILATDGDGPGDILADDLAARFGKEKCCRVQWPSINDAALKDANEVLMHEGAQVLRECIEQAKPLPIDGVFSPNDFRSQVIDLYRGNVAQPLGIGYTELDEIYRVKPQQFHVVTGIPNHGKSNFMDQIMVNLAEKHGWKFAVFSPEHSTEQHVARLIEKRLRRPFYDGPSHRASERQVSEAMDWLDEHFFFVDSSDATPTPDWVISKFRALALREGIQGAVVDPYNEIEASRDPRIGEHEFISAVISKFKRFATGHDVAVWMVAHPRKIQKDANGQEPPPGLYDISGSAHWRNKADAGVVVHRDFERNVTQVFVKKVREQPHCGQIGKSEFVFDVGRRVYTEQMSRGAWATYEQSEPA
jgi:twinkle protein